MVAPVNRIANTPAKSRRRAVLDEAVLATVVALRELLRDRDPKVVLGAAKLILDLEKARLRHGDKDEEDEEDEVEPTSRDREGATDPGSDADAPSRPRLVRSEGGGERNSPGEVLPPPAPNPLRRPEYPATAAINTMSDEDYAEHQEMVRRRRAGLPDLPP